MHFKYCIFILMTCPFLISGKVEFSPDFQKWVQNLHAECAQERKLSEEQIKAFVPAKKDPELMCYLKCMFTRGKWDGSIIGIEKFLLGQEFHQQMDESEVVQADYIRKNIPDAFKGATLPQLDTCGKKAVGGNCEKSYNFFMCMHEASPEDWVVL